MLQSMGLQRVGHDSNSIHFHSPHFSGLEQRLGPSSFCLPCTMKNEGRERLKVAHRL